MKRVLVILFCAFFAQACGSDDTVDSSDSGSYGGSSSVAPVESSIVVANLAETHAPITQERVPRSVGISCQIARDFDGALRINDLRESTERFSATLRVNGARVPSIRRAMRAADQIVEGTRELVTACQIGDRRVYFLAREVVKDALRYRRSLGLELSR